MKNRSKASGILIVVSVCLLGGWVASESIVHGLSSISQSIDRRFLSAAAFDRGILISHFDKETGTEPSAFYNLSIGFGYVAGSVMIGPLLDNFGYGVTAVVFSALALCSGLACSLSRTLWLTLTRPLQCLM